MGRRAGRQRAVSLGRTLDSTPSTSPPPMDFLDHAKALGPRHVEIRRDLHQNPELGFQEVRTAELAAREAEQAGFSVQRGVAKTGVVAELEHGNGPTVAVRADMDALPIQERSDMPYASRVEGVMHACGHDFHTAGLIGVAHLLAEMRDRNALPAGRMRLLFQPSEEGADSDGKSGAMRMVDEGVMEGVNAVIGLHVGAHLPAGTVFLRPGPFFAGSDEIRITVEGKSSHAARPQDGVDAVALASLGVVAAQQVVSRELSPADRGVLTIGTIQGGTAANVIADRVVLTGTLRYFEHEVRMRIQDGVRRAFSGLQEMGARCDVRFLAGYPPVVNEAGVTEWVREAAASVIGKERFLDREPNMEAEDFAFFAERAPGAFFWLGAGLPEPRAHHRADFDLDETVLPLGAALLAQAAVHLLSKLSGSKDGAGNG
jgi:IAA-amino acid hydrolase